MNEEREFKGSIISCMAIIFFLGVLVIALSFNKDRIIFDDYLGVVSIDGKLVKIENPNEYYDIKETGTGYEFRYNDELNTVDLIIHYEFKEL